MKPWLDDASSLADSIRHGDVRSADAVEASLDAIAASKLNAIAYLDAEGARQQAAEIDRRVAAGEDPGLFAGVPLLVKDVSSTRGMPTTHGSVVYKDNVAEHDSTHVARLRAAGAVIVGKSTTSEFGLVAYTATKLHGVTRNPWNLERTPAGSSGGSAAAVAGGLVPAATASDGGGTIRIPAAYTGLVGMKGTFGRIPRGPGARNGPLTSNWGTVARSVRDAARWYDVTSGYDARDPFSLPRIDGWEDATSARATSRGLRVAVAPDLGAAVLEREVARVVADAADALVAETGHAARRRGRPLAGEGGALGERRRAGPVQRPQGLLARLPRRPDVRDPRRHGVHGALPHLARGVGRPLPRRDERRDGRHLRAGRTSCSARRARSSRSRRRARCPAASTASASAATTTAR